MDDAVTVVLPYFNEAGYLRPTLRSLLAQTRPAARLLLIDNGSTDGSADICREAAASSTSTEVLLVSEPRPGKTFALSLADQYVNTPLVAFVDADTYYPPQYLETCLRLFRDGGPRRVAVMAKDLSAPANSLIGIWTRWFYAGVAKLLYWQTFTGGCGQVFRTEALRAAGGYSAERWKYTLEDHEIMNRVRKIGRWCYHRNFWCIPSGRRRDRSNVGWNLQERIVYHCTPPVLGDWFFNRFLAARFERRRIFQANLREHSWQVEPKAEAA